MFFAIIVTFSEEKMSAASMLFARLMADRIVVSHTGGFQPTILLLKIEYIDINSAYYFHVDIKAFERCVFHDGFENFFRRLADGFGKFSYAVKPVIRRPAVGEFLQPLRAYQGTRSKTPVYTLDKPFGKFLFEL